MGKNSQAAGLFSKPVLFCHLRVLMLSISSIFFIKCAEEEFLRNEILEGGG